MTLHEFHDIQNEIRHLTRPYWRVLILVVVAMIGMGAVLQAIHAHQRGEKQHAVNIAR